MAGKKPPYVVSVEYATPEILRELKEKLGFVPPEKGYATVVPVDKNNKIKGIKGTPVEQIGKGVRSKVYVFPRAFLDLYNLYPQLERPFPKPTLYPDMEAILLNGIFQNEFVDAKHLDSGIPDYPIESFRGAKGQVNYKLYTTVLDLLSNKSEYIGLLRNPRMRTSMFMQLFADEFPGIVEMLYYNRLFEKELIADMDKAFIGRLRHEFHPMKLFPKTTQTPHLPSQ